MRVTVDAITMDITVFDAFPNAVISGIWQIGVCKHGTVVGNEFQNLGFVDVIIDEGYNSNINATPETVGADLLVYMKPCQLPRTINKILLSGVIAQSLVSNYMLYNTADDLYYMIVDAGVGKNQHTGEVEHVELKLVATEVING